MNRMTRPLTDFSPERAPIDPADLIAGLGRGLAVIESFDDAHPCMTVAETAAATGIPRSAARRHLLSLCHFGYAETDGKRYWLTPRVLRLGHSYLDAARMPRLVHPFIQRLSMSTGETVNLSVLDGHDVVYVARSNSPRVVSIGFHAGARVPAHVVSPGAVLLSALADDTLRTWIDAHEFGLFSANTIVDREAYLEQVMAARASDFWISRGRLDAGLVGVAVRLTDRRGEIRGAIGMTLQAAFWDDARITAELVQGLQDTVALLRQIV